MMHGNVLERILRHQGYDVMGISHTGDFGTPIGQVVAEVELLQLPFVKAIQENKPGWYITLNEVPFTERLLFSTPLHDTFNKSVVSHLYWCQTAC